MSAIGADFGASASRGLKHRAAVGVGAVAGDDVGLAESARRTLGGHNRPLTGDLGDGTAPGAASLSSVAWSAATGTAATVGLIITVDVLRSSSTKIA